MRQRLGLAQALLPDPEILILDEPTSSLDPQGRKEVLDLIYSLKGDKTVFFSTHILTDVERICDRIGILREGRLLLEDSIENIKRRYWKRRILVEVDDLEKFSNIVKETLPTNLLEIKNNGMIIEVSDIQYTLKEIPKLIIQEDLLLKRLEILEPSLEDIFLEVTNDI